MQRGVPETPDRSALEQTADDLTSTKRKIQTLMQDLQARRESLEAEEYEKMRVYLDNLLTRVSNTQSAVNHCIFYD